jgi:pilus assembly protein FimV
MFWLCCVASPVLAVTLGQEAVLSQLGDPIEVEIDVLQWEDIDIGRVQISLASPSEYENFKLSWSSVLEQLNFNLVGPNTRGEVKVLVSTREPVAEPYVELLLVMRWPGGSLLREYVLLFDLPQSAARSAAAVRNQEPLSNVQPADTAVSGSNAAPGPDAAGSTVTVTSGAASFTPTSEAYSSGMIAVDPLN